MRPSLAFVRSFVVAGAAACALVPGSAARAQEPVRIATKIAGAAKLDGYIPIYWDAAAGKMWMEIGRFDQELLYYISLPAGMGQNDLGLNRGDLGPQYVVQFERVGPRVLLVQSNYAFRATSINPMERKSVTDGFPRSVLWGFRVEAEEGGRVLVDATDFFLRDAQGVVATLRGANQGTYRVDANRSAIYLPRTKGFPKNTEVEATLTFVSDNPGGLVCSVAPSADAVTLREHHSFVELPTGYAPREMDPRGGFFGISYMDYSAPLGQPMVKQFIARHRLEKRNPGAAMSDPVKPIVYYLDPGTPEPIQSALLEGARWWNQAFEAAGFRNAFRVEMLPDTADPMDIRYNMIQWVHRSTRGWSYGASVTDPRTGEILKGHVTLGSLRIRQDYLIGEGLTSPYATGTEAATKVREMALARIRQLAAHEIGHTLGLQHNYISSAQRAGGPQSVMDYPHPVVQLTANGEIDLSAAYETSIGEWDKIAIRWGYGDVSGVANQRVALDTILMNAARRGVTFLTDQDARPAGSAHPLTHLWDNGANVTAELERMLTVRRAALARFGERAIQTHMPLAAIEDVLVPLYLHHRYQTEAVVKSVGGQYYTYALRGDGQRPVQTVPAAEQRRALEMVLRTIDPAELALPRSVISLIPPRPSGFPSSVEDFERYTGLVFDAVSPAAEAADLTLSLLLDPERAARLVEQHALDASLPDLTFVIDRITAATFGRAPRDGYQIEIERAVQRVYADRLIELATRATMPQVRAIASLALKRLSTQLKARAGETAELAHAFAISTDIDRFLVRPLAPVPPPRIRNAPPGMPIGDGEMLMMPRLNLSCDAMW